MKSRICDLLGIDYPVFQGGMAWVAEHHLAAAVSNAGGLGILAAGNAPVDVVREEVRKTKERTDKPFGLNIMLLSPHAPQVADMAIEEGVKVITTGAGSPEVYMKAWKEAGIKVIPVVASVAVAKRMERCGADALVAEGCESGGHIGELTSMVLIPQIADAVSVPVIGAGGVGDGRGMAAMFMLGASGVQLGTRFLVAEECQIHENYKERILAAKDIDTTVTGRSHGHPIRSLKNPMTKQYQKMEKEGAGFEELELLALGSLRKAVTEGDTKNGSMMAGQSAGLVYKRQTCREILQELVSQAEALLRKGWE